ncbi:MAG: AI-2E family transporter [Planctomycetaceae bacterium]
MEPIRPGETNRQERLRRVLGLSALAIFAFLLWTILAPFAVALTWAAILCLSLWPVYLKVRAWAPSRPVQAASLMTLLVTLGIVLPLVIASYFLVGELTALGTELVDIVSGPGGAEVAEQLRTLPLIGPSLADKLVEIREDPELLRLYVTENRQVLFDLATQIVSGATKNLFKILVCLFSTYFLFRYGDGLAQQTRRAMHRLGGERMQALLQHVRNVVKAVVYGMVMTAIVQGIVASLGFWVAGVPYPLLLGGLTVLFSFVPFGPPLVWIPAGIGVLARGDIGWGIALLVYGAAVISTMDNIFRPLFIGQATRMPVLLVFIGVVGGILGFGMVGLFVGPVILAVALVFWRDWAAGDATA